MRLSAACGPSDPVLLFEPQTLYNMEGDLAVSAGPVDLDHAAVRRAGTDVTIVTYGATWYKSLKPTRLLAENLRFVIELKRRIGVDVAEVDYPKLATVDGTVAYVSARLGRSARNSPGPHAGR